MVIYNIHFPNGKVYVGLTAQSIERRIYAHRYAAYFQHKKNKVYRAMRKYQDGPIYYSVIYKADSIEELKEVEKLFILSYDSYNNGYNETLGGEGMSGFKISEETRRKFSEQRKLDSEFRLKNARIRLKDMNETGELSFKISNTKKTLFNNEEYRNRYKESWEKKKKENCSREKREKLSLTFGGKPFIVKSINGDIIGEWISQMLCAEDLNINAKGIGKVLRGERKSYRKMFFAFK